MAHHLPAVLLLSGFLIAPSYFQPHYNFVRMKKTWLEAQRYCRELFTDLATIRDQSAQNKLKNTVPSRYTGSAWIGMFKNASHWWWAADPDKEVEFYNWTASAGRRHNLCVSMLTDGKWFPDHCNEEKHFVCLTGSANGNQTYKLIKDKMSWSSAVSYCKTNHSHIASIMNSTENLAVQSLLSEPAWIGLKRAPWRWSSRDGASFKSWAKDQEHIKSGCVRVKFPSGEWYRDECSVIRNFICNEGPKLTVVRLKLRHSNNLMDPAAHDELLQQLHTALGKHITDFKLRWKSPPRRVEEEESGGEPGLQ